MVDLKIGDAETMTWLQWTASIVHSLAWPVAAVLIASIFRAQISGLLAKVRKLSWGDKTVDFAEKLDQIEEVSGDESIPHELLSRRRSIENDRFEKLLAISPEAAILDAWRPVEMMIQELSGDFEDEGGRRSGSTTARIETLVHHGVMSQAVAHLSRLLLQLRNAAAHGDDALSAADAYRFRELSDKMLDRLEQHLKKPSPPVGAQ